MGILKNRWLTIVTVLMVLILVPACVRFRSEDAQGQQVSLLVPTETNTPFPTATDEPADEATERPTAGDLPISNNPTDTATPTPTDDYVLTRTILLLMNCHLFRWTVANKVAALTPNRPTIRSHQC